MSLNQELQTLPAPTFPFFGFPQEQHGPEVYLYCNPYKPKQGEKKLLSYDILHIYFYNFHKHKQREIEIEKEKEKIKLKYIIKN